MLGAHFNITNYFSMIVFGVADVEHTEGNHHIVHPISIQFDEHYHNECRAATTSLRVITSLGEFRFLYSSPVTWNVRHFRFCYPKFGFQRSSDHSFAASCSDFYYERRSRRSHTRVLWIVAHKRYQLGGTSRVWATRDKHDGGNEFIWYAPHILLLRDTVEEARWVSWTCNHLL